MVTEGTTMVKVGTITVTEGAITVTEGTIAEMEGTTMVMEGTPDNYLEKKEQMGLTVVQGGTLQEETELKNNVLVAR